MRRAWCAAFAAAVALGVPVAAHANAVTDWNRIATDTLVAMPGPAGGAPPALQVNMAMTQGAVYDAVNAITPKHWRPYLLNRRFGATSSTDLAVATAAYGVLSNILDSVPPTIPFGNKGALQASLDAHMAGVLAGIPDSPFRRRGIEAGETAAAAMVAFRAGDGRFGPSQWAMQTGAGYWQPLLVGGVPQLDPTPWVGGVRPFVLTSPTQFRTPGPNALGSPQYMADYNEVKSVGRSDSLTRTGEQTHNAIFWQSAGGPALLWNGTTRNLVLDPKYGIHLGESARLFAMLNIAGADAAINCWNDKYYYDFWRPWNAIAPDDPTWSALLTAPYPEHPSGHLCLDGAELTVMQRVFGTDDVHFGVVSSRFPGETRFFDHFSEPLDEIVKARIWAGLHFRTADLQGRTLGQHVADYLLANYFQPVGNH